MRGQSTKQALRLRLAVCLRQLRKSRELSQEELAARCGLHRTYISLLERAEKSPTVDVLERLAEALAVKPSELLADAERIAEGGGRIA